WMRFHSQDGKMWFYVTGWSDPKYRYFGRIESIFAVRFYGLMVGHQSHEMVWTKLHHDLSGIGGLLLDITWQPRRFSEAVKGYPGYSLMTKRYYGDNWTWVELPWAGRPTLDGASDERPDDDGLRLEKVVVPWDNIAYGLLETFDKHARQQGWR